MKRLLKRWPWYIVGFNIWTIFVKTYNIIPMYETAVAIIRLVVSRIAFLRLCKERVHFLFAQSQVPVCSLFNFTASFWIVDVIWVVPDDYISKVELIDETSFFHIDFLHSFRLQIARSILPYEYAHTTTKKTTCINVILY